MIARLIKNNADEYMILHSDGSYSKCTEENLFNFLKNFKEDPVFSNDGTWESVSAPDMMLYPGVTCAVITDERALLIYDISPFKKLLNRCLDDQLYISAAEFGARHNRSPEIIKVFCRDGRIPGAKQISSTWVVPADAEYPIPPALRRDDVSVRRAGTRKKADKNKER